MVTLGGACTASNYNTGITADYKSVLTCQAGVWTAQTSGGLVNKPTLAQVEGKQTVAYSKFTVMTPCPTRGAGCQYFQVVGGVVQRVNDGSTVQALCALGTDLNCYDSVFTMTLYAASGFGISTRDSNSGTIKEFVYGWN